jgi:hypothetical protein
MVLVGDVFFRRNVVMFDLTHFPGPITIGIAKRDPNYKLATRHAYVSKIQAHKVLPQVRPRPAARRSRREASAAGAACRTALTSMAGPERVSTVGDAALTVGVCRRRSSPRRAPSARPTTRYAPGPATPRHLGAL